MANHTSQGYLQFLPFLKRQLPGLTLSNGQLSSSPSVSVIDAKGAPHPIEKRDLTLIGPGEVLGMSSKMIARTEPTQGTLSFEPNYFPFIEFKDPDFCWRFSLEILDSQKSQARPWLALIVLSEPEIKVMNKEGIEVFISSGQRKVMRCKNMFLPDLDKAWATAHVHFSGKSFDSSKIDSTLRQPKSSYCSRLLSFRRLKPETRYRAFVVPSYKLGAQAGLGLKLDGGDALAWDRTNKDAVVTLPVYYSWSFSTSVSGDFETLTRKLKASPADKSNFGKQVVDANHYRETETWDPKAYFFREGALAPPTFEREMPTLEVTNKTLSAMEKSLDFHEDDENDDDPLITTPIYGRFYRKVIKSEESKQKDENTQQQNLLDENALWLKEVNVELRNRVTAAFGTRAVQDNQDSFMRDCWKQVGEIRKANEISRRFEIACLITQSLEHKHITPLKDKTYFQFISPMSKQLQVASKGQSVKTAFKNTGLSDGFLEPTFRRVMGLKIELNSLNPTAELDNAFAELMPEHTVLAKSNIYAMQTFNLSFSSQLEEKTAIPLQKQTAAAHSWLGFTGEGVMASAKTYPVKQENTSSWRNEISIETMFEQKLMSRIKVTGSSLAKEKFAPIMPSPKINKGAYRYLNALSPDYVIPGVEHLENDGVTLLEENQRFIEAFMLGMNHEMGRELLWNQYPTDQKGTVFQYFWDSLKFDEKSISIKEIHTWTKGLGENKTLEKNKGNQNSNRLVLVIKGELVLRYPKTVFSAMKLRKGEFWSEYKEEDKVPGEILHPDFRAFISPDILCIGFPIVAEDINNGEYYFILQEHQDVLRFGLDTPSEKRKCDSQKTESDYSWNDLVLDSEGFPEKLNHLGNTSAEIAFNTYQQPIKVALHASRLIASETSFRLIKPEIQSLPGETK